MSALKRLKKGDKETSGGAPLQGSNESLHGESSICDEIALYVGGLTAIGREKGRGSLRVPMNASEKSSLQSARAGGSEGGGAQKGKRDHRERPEGELRFPKRRSRVCECALPPEHCEA